MRMSIENIMESPVQNLTMQGLLRNAKVAQKIVDAKGNSVLLEEEEFKLVKDAFDKFEGFTHRDVELCRRVNECGLVEVAKK
jgi:hypothetical protein